VSAVSLTRVTRLSIFVQREADCAAARVTTGGRKAQLLTVRVFAACVCTHSVHINNTHTYSNWRGRCLLQ